MFNSIFAFIAHTPSGGCICQIVAGPRPGGLWLRIWIAFENVSEFIFCTKWKWEFSFCTQWKWKFPFCVQNDSFHSVRKTVQIYKTRLFVFIFNKNKLRHEFFVLTRTNNLRREFFVLTRILTRTNYVMIFSLVVFFLVILCVTRKCQLLSMN